MNDVGDIGRVLLVLYLNQKFTWVVFLLAYCQGDRTESMEQFLTHTTDMYLQGQWFIEERLRRANFQDATMIDDCHAIAEGFYIRKLMGVEEDAHAFGLQLPEKVAHVALTNGVFSVTLRAAHRADHETLEIPRPAASDGR
jgi:hypothetical protein